MKPMANLRLQSDDCVASVRVRENICVFVSYTITNVYGGIVSI